MQLFWLISAICVAGSFFYLFLRGPKQYSPLWLMLAAWSLALLIPRLNLSAIELPLTVEFFCLVMVSLGSFALGFFVWDRLYKQYKPWEKLKLFTRTDLREARLRVTIYVLFILSLLGLFLFYTKAGNFPLLATNPDAFRFMADENVPGLINYTAQLARLFIPLSFFLIFWQTFSFKRHWDLVLISLIGTAFLVLFASRTQIYFIDLWVMALYLFIRRPNVKQSLKFYPVFLLISIVVLAAVPIIRNYKSYGDGYLVGITAIDESKLPAGASYVVPIYVGISFNMQALQHAQVYYETHELQKGKVTLDPFTNILGLHQFKSSFDLGEIFKPWWNTGTYLFPFIQDFGNYAFYIIPFFIAGILTLLWRYNALSPNFLSINLYAYACFFIVMTIYLSFTVRAEMYIDLFLLFAVYLVVSKYRKPA